MAGNTSSTPPPETGRLVSRVALVTGASRGIGRALAKCFAAEGASVVALARTQEALEELDDEIQTSGLPPLALVPADLRDPSTADHLAAALCERFGRLDILVGNAGFLGQMAPMGHITPSLWEDVLSTNLTANWHLLRYLDPLLKRSDAGRAVFLTSSVGRIPRAYWGAYAVSKAALDMMVRTWAEELRDTPVRVNLYDPGGTRTSMRASAFPGEDPETLPPPEVHCPPILDLVVPETSRSGEIVPYREHSSQTLPAAAKSAVMSPSPRTSPVS